MSFFYQKSNGLRVLSLALAFIFAGSLFASDIARAATGLPGATQMLGLSPNRSLPVLMGLKLDPANPLRIEFIIDRADAGILTREETGKLVRYFLAGLTVPEKDLWVNLSPYEKDRIIAAGVADTDAGRDMLAQDYILKQLVSSLTCPDHAVGKEYWQKTYQQAAKLLGTSNLPVNTFNKIWITSGEAKVYECKNTVLIEKAELKAMLEEDFLALSKNVEPVKNNSSNRLNRLNQLNRPTVNKIASDVMREVVVPKITDDINKGDNFAVLRQIYSCFILAKWFKEKFKDSCFKHYINQKKIKTIDINDPQAKEKIYNLYTEAFKKGIYDYIRKESDPATNKRVRRRYSSGGMEHVMPMELSVRRGNDIPEAAYLGKHANSAVVEFNSGRGVDKASFPNSDRVASPAASHDFIVTHNGTELEYDSKDNSITYNDKIYRPSGVATLKDIIGKVPEWVRRDIDQIGLDTPAYYYYSNVEGVNLTLMLDPVKLGLPIWMRNKSHTNGSYLEGYRVVYKDKGAEVVALSVRDGKAEYVIPDAREIYLDGPKRYTELLTRGGMVLLEDTISTTPELQDPASEAVKVDYAEPGVVVPIGTSIYEFAFNSGAGDDHFWQAVRPGGKPLWTTINLAQPLGSDDPLYGVITRILNHPDKDNKADALLTGDKKIVAGYFTRQRKVTGSSAPDSASSLAGNIVKAKDSAEDLLEQNGFICKDPVEAGGGFDITITDTQPGAYPQSLEQIIEAVGRSYGDVAAFLAGHKALSHDTDVSALMKAGPLTISLRPRVPANGTGSASPAPGSSPADGKIDSSLAVSMLAKLTAARRMGANFMAVDSYFAEGEYAYERNRRELMKWANDLFWRAHSLLRFEFNEGSLGNDTGFKFLEIIAKSSGGIDKGAVQENTQSFLFALSIWYLSEKPYEHGGAKWILKTYFNIDLDKQDVRRQFYEQIDNWLDDKIDGLTDSGAHSVSSSAVKSAASPAGAPVYGSMAEDDFIKKSTDWLIGRVKEAWYHRPGGSGEFRPYLPRAALHDTTKGKIAEKKKKKLMGGLVNGLVWYANVRAVTVRGQGKSIDKKRYIDTGMDFLDGAIKDDRVGFTDWTETDPAERDKSFPCSDLTQLVSWLADLREFYETVRHAVEDPVEEAIPPHDVGGEVSSSAAANPAGKEAAYPVRDGGIKMGDINLARSGASSGIKFAALGPEFFEHLKFTILAIKEIPSLGEYASLP